MSEIQGTEGFETPDEKELQDYLKQSRKSLSLMREGKPPHFFKPKKRIFTKLASIMILIVISSSVIIILPMLSNQISPNYRNNTADQSSSSTLTSSILTTSEPTTSEPDSSKQDLRMVIQELELIIDEMISSNPPLIYPIMVNGTINTSRVISVIELLNLIWYLNQFNQDSNWWDLGRELLINENNLWGESARNVNGLSVQLQTLRGLLAYSQDELAFEPTNRETYGNTCRILWDKIINVFDNSSNTLSSSENSSLRFTSDQILFVEVLTNALNHSNLFSQEMVQDYILRMINTLDQVIGITGGLPDSFYSNKSLLSPIYQFRHQGEIVLALKRLNTVFGVVTTESILNRVDDLISNYFVNQDWSGSSWFNFTSMQASNGVFVQDQALLIRTQVAFERLTYAKYTANTLVSLFNAPNNGFYSSIEDRQTQYLIDQIYILLAFQELITLESSEEAPGAASWGVEIVILAIALLLVKRGYFKRRNSKRKSEKR